ncbi:hypothetical protein BGZ65_004994, partial [Modicella reniformis]
MVFLPTTRGAQLYGKVFASLSMGKELSVYEIHSSKSQRERTLTSRNFRRIQTPAVLFTSDISARGVDYPGVGLVIQVGAPLSLNHYIHRIGRTGRGDGKKGMRGRGSNKNLGDTGDDHGKGVLILGELDQGFIEHQLKPSPLFSIVKREDKYDDWKSVMLGENLDRRFKRALSNVDEKLVKSAYTAFLGYSPRIGNTDRKRILEAADSYIEAFGILERPAVSTSFLERMGFMKDRVIGNGEEDVRQQPHEYELVDGTFPTINTRITKSPFASTGQDDEHEQDFDEVVHKKDYMSRKERQEAFEEKSGLGETKYAKIDEADWEDFLEFKPGMPKLIAKLHNPKRLGHTGNRPSKKMSKIFSDNDGQERMSNSDHPQEQHPQDHEQDTDEDYDDWSEQEFYDPEDDLAYFHDQKFRIEESWLEWERQNSVGNRPSEGFHGFSVFQKPGSMKKRERRQRSAQALLNARVNNRSASTSSSSSGPIVGSGPGGLGADSKTSGRQRRQGSSIVHSYSNSEWEATLAAREERLAAKARRGGTGRRVLWGLTTGQVALTTLAYAAAGQTFQTFVGFHVGPVSCVKLIRDHLGFVLTGGVDGVVKLWDVYKAQCVGEFRTGSTTIPNGSQIDHICCDPGSYIIAGTSGGEIYVWKADINAMIYLATESTSDASPDASSDNLGTTPNMTPSILIASQGNAGTFNSPPKIVKLPEEFMGVRYMKVEFGLRRSGLILAQAMDANVLHVYCLETLMHLATLKSPAHDSPITAIYWDTPRFENPMISPSNGSSGSTKHILHGRQEKSGLLVTGDNAGNVCLWYLSDIVRRRMLQKKDHHLHTEPLVLEPSLVLEAHDTKVTSLFVDALVVVSGSMDGSAKAWNPINGDLISILNTPHIRGRNVNDMSNLAVNCIVVNSSQCRGVLSVGGLIRSWDFSPEATLIKDKNRKPTTRKPVHYSGGPKGNIQDDIRNSVRETVSLRRLEALAKDQHEQLHRRYNNLKGLNMTDMTDEEVVEYVMMLSKEQDDQEAAQIAQEIQAIQELEDEVALEQPTESVWSNGVEGLSGSSTSRMQASPTAASNQRTLWEDQ